MKRFRKQTVTQRSFRLSVTVFIKMTLFITAAVSKILTFLLP